MLCSGVWNIVIAMPTGTTCHEDTGTQERGGMGNNQYTQHMSNRRCSTNEQTISPYSAAIVREAHECERLKELITRFVIGD